MYVRAELSDNLIQGFGAKFCHVTISSGFWRQILSRDNLILGFGAKFCHVTISFNVFWRQIFSRANFIQGFGAKFCQGAISFKVLAPNCDEVENVASSSFGPDEPILLSLHLRLQHRLKWR
jgi:hypothetical protein